ncbi:MAG: hypothetical protein KTR19_03575 [Hyphomicrobiales bacterium]|nr:hypothetical protein [Hyphomicrobiales bacterium]
MYPPIRRNAMIRPVHDLTLFLAAAFTLVYALILHTAPVKAEKMADGKATPPAQSAIILRDPDILPDSVQRMRRAMIVAAMTGEIEAMRMPVEMNEIPPIISTEKTPDPIQHWKTISGDGEGREILAIIVKLFRAGFVREAPNTGDEMFVWPYFAKMPIAELTPAQKVELLTIVPPDRLKAMQAANVYNYYRIGIAHDGTWHFFLDEDM